MEANSTKTEIKWKRAFLRSLYYYRVGYGTYLALPVSLFGYASSIYYLAVENIPILKNLFPRFHEFLFMAFILIYPLASLIGWYHFKKSPFFRAEQTILAEANPYSVNKLPAISIPMWELWRVFAVEKNLPHVVAHIDKVRRESIANIDPQNVEGVKPKRD